jgi:hypothetical protein
MIVGRGRIVLLCGRTVPLCGHTAELQLSIHRTSHSIRGHAGGIIRAYGTVDVALTVDLIIAAAEAIVVDEDLQLIPIIIGQVFLICKNVTIVIRNNQVRLFVRIILLPCQRLLSCHLEKSRCGQTRL